MVAVNVLNPNRRRLLLDAVCARFVGVERLVEGSFPRVGLGN